MQTLKYTKQSIHDDPPYENTSLLAITIVARIQIVQFLIDTQTPFEDNNVDLLFTFIKAYFLAMLNANFERHKRIHS